MPFVANRPAPLVASNSAASAAPTFQTVTRFRFLAAGLIAAFVLALPESRHGGSTVYNLELVAFGLAHYCLSLHYARGQVGQLLRRPATWLPAAAVTLFCASFIAIGAIRGSMSDALLVYFGIHHVFNEVHMSSLANGWKDRDQDSRLRTCATAFHAFLYTAVIINDRSWLASMTGPVLAGLLVSAAVYAYALLRAPGTVRTPAELLRANAFEICALGFALAVCTLKLHVRWTDVVLFHFVYWLMYPTLKLRAAGSAATRRYLVENITLVLGFGVLLAFLDRSISRDLFNIGSFFHIATSFALSRAQPAWITRWFWPQPAPSPLVASSR